MTLGAAVVGLGVGERHARAYAGSSGCTLRWLLDLDAAKAGTLARDLGGVRVASGLDEILKDPQTQVVSIASYDDVHAEQVVAALRAGKHVFVEKPLCRSPRELDAIRKAWEAGGRPHLASNLILREAPLYRWLRDRIVAGDLGRLYAFDGEYLYGRLPKITEGWRKDVKGYSVMQGGGIHLLDLMLGLTGEKPATAFAAGNRICTEGTAFQSPDYVAATYRFASGLLGRITANFGCVHKHQHVVRVFGTKATFLYDDSGPRLYTLRDPGGPPERPEAAPEPADKGVLIPAFVRAILGKAPSDAGAAREFDLLRACFAADQALAEGREVSLDSACVDSPNKG